jgi:Erv1/Alr family protein
MAAILGTIPAAFLVSRYPLRLHLHPLCPHSDTHPHCRSVPHTACTQGLGTVYPCKVCADDFTEYIAEHPPAVESRESLSVWMCEAHNAVNIKISKPVFPCERVMERWRIATESVRSSTPATGTAVSARGMSASGSEPGSGPAR